MSTIFEYLHWRGDLTLEQASFHPIDALILARLSYFPFDGIVSSVFHEAISLEACAVQLFQSNLTEDKWNDRRDLALLKTLQHSERFRRMRLSAFINEIDQVTEKQFSAVNIDMLDGSHFISFRGTDNTFVGWKEDFNMSFETAVPSQRAAVLYLNDAVDLLSGIFRVGGHSKGGNLAVYSSALLSPLKQIRIEAVYNLDGPGFHTQFLDYSGYQCIRSRTQTYVPQSSIVGMLLEHEESYHVIHSNQKGILQHDLYSWEVSRDNFVYLKTVTEGSVAISETIKIWLSHLSRGEREQFVDALFGVLSLVKADTFPELVQNLPQNAPAILKSIGKMDSQNRKALQTAIQSMLNAIRSTALQYLPFPKVHTNASLEDTSEDSDA